MGYEVLDSGGTGREAARAFGSPADLVAFEDLPEPEPGPAALGARPLRRPPVLDRLRRRNPAGSPTHAHPWRALGAWSAVAALVGLALGLAWSGHHAAQVRLASARQTVSALATVNTFDRVATNEGPAGDFSIRVFNVGSLPLRLAVSPPDEPLTRGHPQVSLSSGSAVVAPQSSQTVISRVLLDCNDLTTIRPTVTLQAPDGSSHEMRVQDDGSGTVLPTAADLCNQLGADQPAVEVNLGGTLAKPAVQLTNTTDRQIEVSWDFEVGGGGLGPDRHDVELSSTPALPLTLEPHQSQVVALHVVVHGCRVDQPIQHYQSLGYMNLSAMVNEGLLPDDAAPQPITGIDLSAVLGAALQRSCG